MSTEIDLPSRVEFLHALPAVRPSSTWLLLGASQCGICGETMKDKTLSPESTCQPVILTCGHYFCNSCTDLWLENNNTCPYCRCVLFEKLLDERMQLLQVVEEEYDDNDSDSDLDGISIDGQPPNEITGIDARDRVDLRDTHADTREYLSGNNYRMSSVFLNGLFRMLKARTLQFLATYCPNEYEGEEVPEYVLNADDYVTYNIARVTPVESPSHQHQIDGCALESFILERYYDLQFEDLNQPRPSIISHPLAHCVYNEMRNTVEELDGEIMSVLELRERLKEDVSNWVLCDGVQRLHREGQLPAGFQEFCEDLVDFAVNSYVLDMDEMGGEVQMEVEVEYA